MVYFTKDYFKFFKELAANNHKDWFDENRKRYHTVVKEPFEKFIGDLIQSIQKIDPNVDIAPKDAIFRINRDIRFSADKTPYKLNRSAIISPGGKKDKAHPGLYIEVGPEHIRIYGGVYQPDKEQLYTIRETITKNPDSLKKLMSDPSFVSTFGSIKGEKNKLIPKEFKEIGKKEDLLYNKQFYWYAEMSPQNALKADFIDQVMKVYTANQPLMTYFTKAMK
ncbi:MAG: DUF2461 domain-containing protein [Crocinitomicaceae bacterium]